MNDRFQETLQLMKQRWPAIGRELDHPLAGWYLQKITAQPRSAPFKAYAIKWLYALGAFFCLVLCDIVFKHRLDKNSFLAGGIIAACMLLLCGEHPPCSPMRYLESKDKRFLRDLWLSGISCRELLAICIMLRIRPYTRRRFWTEAFILVAILVVAIYFLAQTRIFGPRHLAPVFSVWVVLIAVYHLFANPKTTAIATINKFSSTIDELFYDPKKLEFVRGLKLCLWVGLGFVLFMVSIVAFASLDDIASPVPFIVVSLILLAVSCVIEFYVHYIQPQSVMMTFSERSGHCQEILPEIIYRESELSVK